MDTFQKNNYEQKSVNTYVCFQPKNSFHIEMNSGGVISNCSVRLTAEKVLQ